MNSRVRPRIKVDASRNKREFQKLALICRVLMFIFGPLIKFSDNLRDLFSIFFAPISRFTLDHNKKKRYFIGSGSDGITKTVKNARTKWLRDSLA